MGSSGGLMAASYGSQALASVGTAYSQGQAQKAQGSYQQAVGNINAGYATLSANDAINRGGTAAAQTVTQASRVASSQRANAAAQGIDVNSGSAADIQAGTKTVGALDALNIKNNAYREAWGYQVQGANATAQGNFQKLAGDSAAGNTFLTGGMNALGYGMRGIASYKGTGGGLTVPASMNPNSGNFVGPRQPEGDL